MPKKTQKPQQQFTLDRVKEMQRQVEEDQKTDKIDHKNHIDKPFDEIIERIVRVPKPKKD